MPRLTGPLTDGRASVPALASGGSFVPGRMAPQWTRSLLPAPFKSSLKFLLCSAVDLFDAAFKPRDPLMPPARLRVRVGCFRNFLFTGPYRAVGEEFARHLQAIAGLKPGDAILDLGCGCGLVAGALAKLGIGRYEGVDPDREAIEWCRRNIASRCGGFRFQSVDLYNGYYNPQGAVKPAEWRFPFEAAAFDVVLLKSVFTHMLRADMERYLREIARVLRPGGRCLATLYVLNAESLRRMAAGGCDFTLAATIDGGRAFRADIPEYIVAWDEHTVRQAAAQAGLAVRHPVHYGAWCGRAGALSYQDMLVFEHSRR